MLGVDVLMQGRGKGERGRRNSIERRKKGYE
jgi:hypothetical protein